MAMEDLIIEVLCTEIDLLGEMGKEQVEISLVSGFLAFAVVFHEGHLELILS